MSWGERSCSVSPCKIAAMENCNVLCPGYTWDGKTPPDNPELLTKTQRRLMGLPREGRAGKEPTK